MSWSSRDVCSAKFYNTGIASQNLQRTKTWEPLSWQSFKYLIGKTGRRPAIEVVVDWRDLLCSEMASAGVHLDASGCVTLPISGIRFNMCTAFSLSTTIGCAILNSIRRGHRYSARLQDTKAKFDAMILYMSSLSYAFYATRVLAFGCHVNSKFNALLSSAKNTSEGAYSLWT